MKIEGIIVPVLTPMGQDEEILPDEFCRQIERLITAGIQGIFPCGTNGEGYILSLKEKEELFEAAVAQAKGRVPVYAGTGCISTADTVRLSRRAWQLGVDALSVITPSFAAASQQELYLHYKEIAKQVDLPIVLYNIPQRTGNRLLPQTVRRLAEEIEQIAGIKDSSGDMANLEAYLALAKDLKESRGKDFAVLAGNDSAILSCLEKGGAGAVAGRANLYPAAVEQIYQAFRAGEWEKARQAQESINSLQKIFAYGNPNTIIKKAAVLLGYPVGECRRPFQYLSEEGMEALRQLLQENREKGLH